MKLVKDYKETYERLGPHDYLTFYGLEYGKIRQVFNYKIVIQLIMTAIFFMSLTGSMMLYEMDDWMKVLAVLVSGAGVIMSVMDRWQASGVAVAFFVVLALLCNDKAYNMVFCFANAALWGIVLVDCLRMKNLKEYFSLAKIAVNEKEKKAIRRENRKYLLEENEQEDDIWNN